MSYSLDTLVGYFGRCSLDDEQRKIQPPIEIESRFQMVNCIYICGSNYEWTSPDYNKPYQKVSLNSSSMEYLNVKCKFNATSNRIVTGIERIENPFLYTQYQLKLAEKRRKYGYGSVTEHTLFHGTKSCYIDSICTYNFDRRKIGCHGYRSSRFGSGISFSPSANYASAYPRRHADFPRKMLVVKVLEVSRCLGQEYLLIPPEPHDTTYGMDGNVVVKYFDNEFYPEYIISYN